MPRTNAFVTILATTLLLGACGEREAGPHEVEFGEVFYWNVTATNVTFDSCTDAGDWQASIAPPPVEENSFVVYLLSDDGSTATTQDCDTTQASSCVPSSTGIVFTVDGHLLTYDPAPTTETLTNTACELESDQLWTLTDAGESAHMDAAVAFSLVGGVIDCTTADADIQASAPNGLGIDGCVVTLGVDMEFHSTGRP